MRSADQPPEGWCVVTMDAVVVGEVGASAANAFRVDGPGIERWLRLDAVFRVEERVVRLLCNASGLARYTIGQSASEMPAPQALPAAGLRCRRVNGRCEAPVLAN